MVPRRAKRRDANEGEVVEALRRAGAAVWRLDEPCDLLVGYRQRFVTLEIKDGAKSASRRTLTPQETRFADDCAWHRLPHYVVLSASEAVAAIGASEAQA